MKIAWEFMVVSFIIASFCGWVFYLIVDYSSKQLILDNKLKVVCAENGGTSYYVNSGMICISPRKKETIN